MKRFTLIAVMIIALFSFAAVGMAQDNHTVTVAVSAVNEIDVSDAEVVLTINSATAGSDLDAATDATSTLDWTTNQASRKITVAINSAYSTGLTVTVTAGTPSGTGTAVGTVSGSAVTLSTTAADLVTAISNAYAQCSLTYEASASVTAGVISSESRTVTYTITGS
ncbi:hypothetical protein JXO52_00550 [bacterium]|nr:hypothetical protein [bacterium]